MASVTLNTRYRPVRVAFCVRDKNLAAVTTAMDWAHVLWGGRFCPIIPCDDLERAKRLAESFGVDTLYPVTNDNVIDGVIASCKPIAWPFLDRNFFVHDGA